MKEYRIATASMGWITELNDPLWKKITPLKIDCFPWDSGGYKSNTEVRLIATDSQVTVLFETDETPVLARFRKLCDPVCRDSCMEFFFRPDGTNENDTPYMNLEFNPFGTMYIGFGGLRGDRKQLLDTDAAEFDIKTEITENGWKLMFTVKFEFVKKYFDSVVFPWRGNFYKCSDDKKEPSWGCWNPIISEKPDFHRPKCFGLLVK